MYYSFSNRVLKSFILEEVYLNHAAYTESRLCTKLVIISTGN